MNTTLSKEEWLALRKNYIGASEAPVIMNGFHFNRTPYMLWEEKLGFREGAADNFAMQQGRLKEEAARQAYEKYTGNLVHPQMVFHKEKKFMMATLDGLSFNGDIAVEIKWAGEEDHEEACRGRVPQKYFPQTQHQLACLEHDVIHYFSCRGRDRRLVEVERNHDYISDLYAKEEDFWAKVLNLEAPDLTVRDYQDKTSDEVWQMYAEKWDSREKILAKLLEEKKRDRDWFISRSEGMNAQGHGMRACFIKSPKGRVDYSAIPELQGIDLDQYRKPGKDMWRVELTK